MGCEKAAAAYFGIVLECSVAPAATFLLWPDLRSRRITRVSHDTSTSRCLIHAVLSMSTTLFQSSLVMASKHTKHMASIHTAHVPGRPLGPHIRQPIAARQLLASALPRNVETSSGINQNAPTLNIERTTASRRHHLLGWTATLAAALLPMQPLKAAADELAADTASQIDSLEVRAFEAYANREFQTAVDMLTRIISLQPDSPRWYEMRAQVLVDGKNFEASLADFKAAVERTPDAYLTDRARLLAGRALAYEGLSQWRNALQDYTEALELAYKGGESPDPYVINSRGNCYNSLGMWQEARQDYLDSSQLFQQAKGFRGPGGSTTQRLDGSIFAASNAALMLAQMGDEDGAVKEMERIARKAPGSVDMRAALAALYWARGQPGKAEDMWEFACDKITVGCSKYQDRDWLVRIRRWPPVMADRMSDFLQLQRSGIST